MNINNLFAKVALLALVLGGVPLTSQAQIVVGTPVALTGSSGTYSKAFDVGQKFLDTLTLSLSLPTDSVFRWTISSPFTPDIRGFRASVLSRGPGISENSGGAIRWFSPWQGEVFLGTGVTNSMTIDFTLFGKARPDSIYTVSWESVSLVPEPEIWTMMMVGAGLISYQVRRKQRALNRKAMLA